MSLFRGENVYPTAIVFNAATVTPTPVVGGTMWYDPSQHTLYLESHFVQASVQQCAGVNVAAATATNPSATANLMSIAVPGNVLNVVGKMLHIVANGVYNVQGTPTLTFNVALGATGILSFISGATTNAAVNMPWSIDAYVATQTTGTSGFVVAGGKAAITLGTNAALSTTTYQNIPAANVAYNCAQVSNVQVSVLSSTNNVNTVVVQQFMAVEIEN